MSTPNRLAFSEGISIAATVACLAARSPTRQATDPFAGGVLIGPEGLGWADRAEIDLLANVGLGFLFLLAGLQSQSGDVLEAADVDGASVLQTFRYMTLPHLRTYAELATLLGTVLMVQVFDPVNIITKGGVARTFQKLKPFAGMTAIENVMVGAFNRTDDVGAARVGEQVARGQLLGTAGCTGWCTGTHLHFELRLNDAPIDPAPFLG